MKRSALKRTLLDTLTSCGALIRKAIHRKKNIRTKAEFSLVTETDCASEKLAKQIIRRAFPRHGFLTEESPAEGSTSERWIIDPVDGTTNFAHGFPVCCISIAFEKDNELLAGGVYDPFRDEMFTAFRGQGAALNGKKIHVSPTRTLHESLLVTGFPYDRREKADEYLSALKKIMVGVQGVRRSGSAAMDLCYVACGRFDGYWEKKLNSWDKAAGMLIVREAGGRLTDYSGRELRLDSSSNLATNGRIHRELLRYLRPYSKP
jgi:myo-inositol-1(or 4)-monophosphatase